MERRLIIHVGPHKTASTYIQKTLRKNTNRLEELKIGIPRQPISHTRHRDFAKKMKSKNQKFWNKELEALRDNNHILISSEAFCNRISNRKNLNFLLKIAKRHNLSLTLIYFVRDQADLITSQYCHGIRRFYRSDNFKDFLQRRLDEDRKKHRSTYNLADRFKNRLNRSDIDLIFIPLTRQKDPFLEMASKLGWPTDKKWKKLNENESSNPQPGCKGIWLSKVAYDICKEANYPIKSLKNKGQVIRDLAIEKGWHQDRFYGYTNSLYKKVKRYYFQSNQTFSHKVWGADWDTIVEVKQKPYQVYKGPKSRNEYKELVCLLRKSFKKMGWKNLDEKTLNQLLKATRPELNRFS